MAKQQSKAIQPGTKLTAAQARELDSELATILTAVAQRRKNTLLVHNSLQNTIGMFLQSLGWDVEYEVPYLRGGWDAERVVFDIVGSHGTQEIVVEVKDAITPRDLGQVYGYALTLQLSKEKAQLYLGTDILNYADVTRGVIGEAVKELMQQKGLGLILADKYVLMICDNHPQLTLGEMPFFMASEEPVG